jgi:hypothetical protein
MTTETPAAAKRGGFLSLPFVRDLLIVALVLIIAWKLLSADLKIDLATFSFNDFLALVLALFSVGLSVAFYFKANEASNQFYDNTYKFTKDMSEILGRIEAGFGERLRHLDEGYSGMRERLDKLPQYGATPLEVKEEEEVVAQKEQEGRALIEELAQKAKLAEHEKAELFQALEKVNEELELARSELREMRKGSRKGSISNEAVLSYVGNVLKRACPSDQRDAPPSTVTIRRLYRENMPMIAKAAKDDLRKLGLVDESDMLTRSAALLIREDW